MNQHNPALCWFGLAANFVVTVRCACGWSAVLVGSVEAASGEWGRHVAEREAAEGQEMKSC